MQSKTHFKQFICWFQYTFKIFEIWEFKTKFKHFAESVSTLLKEYEFPEPKEYEFPEPKEYEFPGPKNMSSQDPRNMRFR